MPEHGDDRLLWLLLASGCLVAYYAIPKTLEHVNVLTEERRRCEPGKKRRPKCDENDLELDTLYRLATGPSFEIRASTIQIISDRMLADADATRLLLHHLASRKPAQRDRAIATILFLHHERAVPSIKADAAAFDAVVTALANALDDHADALYTPSALPTSPVRPPFRPPHERKLLEIMHALHGAAADRSALLSVPAGLVPRWLARYPFPCLDPAYPWRCYARHDITGLFDVRRWATDDPVMAAVFRDLNRCPAALDALCGAGLDVPTRPSRGEPSYGDSGGEPRELLDWERQAGYLRELESPMSEREGGVVRWPLNPEGSELLEARWTAAATDEEEHEDELQTGLVMRAAVERSPEEESLRRRHREAVVVAERGMPFGPGNILERSATIPEAEADAASVSARTTITATGNVTATATATATSTRAAAVEAERSAADGQGMGEVLTEIQAQAAEPRADQTGDPRHGTQDERGTEEPES